MLNLTDNLPILLRGSEMLKLAYALGHLWQEVISALEYSRKQLDLAECSDLVLELHAWQKDIQRFPGEGNPQLRSRIANATIFHQRAGTTAGFAQILETYGVVQQIEERPAGEDWDIIRVQLAGTPAPLVERILPFIAKEYGASCRRFVSFIQQQNKISLSATAVEYIQENDTASITL